jgi:hypothetical protein
MLTKNTELTTDMLTAYVRDALDSAIDINDESYYEGVPDSANMDLMGVQILDRVKATHFVTEGFKVLDPKTGKQWVINVLPIPDAIFHFHPTQSDPENGPSPDDIPEKCYCTDPDADTTVWPDKCPACIRHQTAQEDKNARCSHHWEVGGRPKA